MPTTTRTLSEDESLRLVARHGVPVVDQRRAADVDEAVDAANALGYPVVVKLHGEAIAHKTERGLVRLGLGDRDAVRAAAGALLAAAVDDDGPVDLLVARMVVGNRELVAGVHVDPQFGR
jgi:acetyl-CoA synthetase (ADP-forming)